MKLFNKFNFTELQLLFSSCKVRNHLHFPNGLRENLSIILQGSKDRLPPFLNMFQLILKHRKRYQLYLDYAEDTQIDLFHKFLALGRTDLGDRVHVCLSHFLKLPKSPSIPFLQTSFVYVEMHCEFPVSVTYTREFLLFFKLWLKRIKATKILEFSRDVVEDFIAHAPRELVEDANRLIRYL